MDNQSQFVKQFLKLLTQAVEKRIYGSIEVYFEAGQMTQVTQRIINKIKKRRQSSIKINFSSKVEGDKDGNTLLTS